MLFFIRFRFHFLDTAYFKTFPWQSPLPQLFRLCRSLLVQSLVVPEFLLLCEVEEIGSDDSSAAAISASTSKGRGSAGTLSASLEATLRHASLTPLVTHSPITALLEDYEAQAAAFSALFEESMWHELEPTEARKYITANEEILDLQKQLDRLRSDVHSEKQVRSESEGEGEGEGEGGGDC